MKVNIAGTLWKQTKLHISIESFRYEGGDISTPCSIMHVFSIEFFSFFCGSLVKGFVDSFISQFHLLRELFYVVSYFFRFKKTFCTIEISRYTFVDEIWIEEIEFCDPFSFKLETLTKVMRCFPHFPEFEEFYRKIKRGCDVYRSEPSS